MTKKKKENVSKVKEKKKKKKTEEDINVDRHVNFNILIRPSN